VITMTPTGGETGVRNSSLSIQLLLAHGARLGWRRLKSWQSRSPSIKKPRRMAGPLGYLGLRSNKPEMRLFVTAQGNPFAQAATPGDGSTNT
jgi:hypothetical protein